MTRSHGSDAGAESDSARVRAAGDAVAAAAVAATAIYGSNIPAANADATAATTAKATASAADQPQGALQTAGIERKVPATAVEHERVR